MSQPMPRAVVASAVEHQLRQIVDGSSAVIYVKDLDGRLQLVNPAFEALFGLSADEALGRTDYELFPPEVADALRANDLRVVELGKALEFEEQVQLGSGTRTYLSNKFPLFDSAGRVVAVCGMSTDISARKRLEEALQHIALGVSAASGAAVFEEIARYLAYSLNADITFVARLQDPVRQCLDTLAVYAHGRLRENISYELDGTPCEKVVGKGFHLIPEGACERFPEDRFLNEFGLDSYAGYPLFASDGRPIGLIAAASRGMLDDYGLTEALLKVFSVRAAAEIERSDAEVSYREIFDSSEDAIFVQDLHSGVLVDVNPKACQAYGYSYAEMLGLTIDDLSAGYRPYTGEDAAGWLARARDLGPQRFEWHRRNRDGSLHWDEVVLKRATIGGVERILAITREITQRKEAEQALRASEQQYRAIVSTALDCIISMDGEGRIQAFNPAAEHCFGYTREQAIGRSLVELIIPARNQEAHQLGFQRYLHGGPFLGRRVEIEACRANGQEFPAELAVTAVEGPQGPQFIGYLRDITELKEAEAQRAALAQQLRQAQRMEAIGHLSGGIAHDFNNLLTGMLGYTVMAEELAEQLPDERLGHYLTRVQRAAEKARDLIQQMLTFSRGSRVQPRAVNLSERVGGFIRLVESSLPASVEIETRLAPDLPPALVDPVQLEQVLMNLCINARDAMSGVGRLRVTLQAQQPSQCRCASCQQVFSGRYLVLSVSDSGPGIAAAVREHMFEPFFTTKASRQGSGMGLSLVHGIVHEYAGHILVDSREGMGSTFQVFLPALAEDTPCPDNPAEQEAAAQSVRLQGRVAVVDDEGLVSEFMADRLSGWGLQVRCFDDAEQAGGVLCADPFAWDFVILDQCMPRLTGLQLARRLLALRADLPIVLYSGFSDQLSEAQVQAEGLKAMLRKPLDQAQLHRLLRRHLARPES
ncbi:hybrid sensor histidine kinase/response regulator [Zestomonas carbonaria]|uniref:histidine kinase n=1 Tax=Zestomonas carbonaria TaxID=2762745 RepID=A0A7U7ERR0_9GAMM|nr:PAS domain S-box protein [Pseudomonas carbonaria]CAD5109633.1 Sensor histidine kinase RcsC [Pseudomonas carbonaria]